MARAKAEVSRSTTRRMSIEAATVGRPLPGVTITLRREDRQAEGAPIDGGRVHVAGDAVSSGYAGQAPADEAFTDGGFLTGDFGRFDARQRLILTGRASSFINVAGKKIQPEEVEQVLRSMRGVEDVRVLGVADAVRGQQVVACVVTQAHDLTAPEIRQFCGRAWQLTRSRGRSSGWNGFR